MLTRATQTIKKFFRHPLFFSFYLPSLLTSIALGLRTPVLPLYASELSGSYSLVGLVVAAEGLGTLMADLPVGALVRRMDRRLGMIIGLTIEALSTLALIWVDSVGAALLLRLVSGVGLSLFGIARHTYITEAVRMEIRGQALSLFGGVLRIGLFIGPAIGGLIAARFGLRLPFVAYTVICFLAILVMIFAKDQYQLPKQETPSIKMDNTGLRGALKGRALVFTSASLAQILAQITRTGQSLILPLWGADVLMLSPDQIGWVVSLSAAVSMTLFYPVGLIMDRIGRKVAIVPSFVLMGLGLAILPMTTNYQGLLLVAALIGLGHGMGSGAMLTLGSDLAPESGRSVFLSAWRWIGDAGSSGGPVIVGLVAEALALPNATLVIAAAGFLAGGVFAFLVPETLRKKPYE